jgi:predicted unusual protein kinase regulating ubiquinone biosynthesis (AarF/ABC1/UbiB family)
MVETLLGRRASWLVVFIGLLLSANALTAEPVPGPQAIYFQDAITATRGMDPQEAQRIKKGIFDQYKVIDLEKSGLAHIQSWLEELNARLTQSVEQLGDEFPIYRISVLATDEPTAFIYKYRPAAQKYYRGHVYISSMMLSDMMRTLGTDAQRIEPAQLKTLLKGIQGVMAHEFAHPKQDELVKWDWRASQGFSRSSHGQADEMSTDLMSMRILRQAELEGESTLTGLQLVFGEKPETGNFVGRTVNALVSTHPEDGLRLNIIRAGLAKLRIDEGNPPVKPIAYSFEGLRGDLGRILELADLRQQIQAAAAAEGSDSVLIAALRLARVNITREITKFPPGDGLSELARHLAAIAEIQAENPRTTEAEARELASFTQFLFEKRLNDGLWTFNGSGSGDRDPFELSTSKARRLQRLYRRIPAYTSPTFKRWLDEASTDVFAFAIKGASGFEVIPAYLPKEYVESLYQAALGRVDTLPSEQKRRLLLQLWFGTLKGGLTVEFEEQVMDRILRETEAGGEMLTLFAGYAGQFVETLYDRAILLERIAGSQARHPDQAAIPLLRQYSELMRKVIADPEQFKGRFTGPYFLYLGSRTRSIPLDLISWDLAGDRKFLPFTRKYGSSSPAMAQYLADTFASPAWQGAIGDWLDQFKSGIEPRTPEQVAFLGQLFRNSGTPLTMSQKEQVLEPFMLAQRFPASALDRAPVEYLRYRVGLIRTLSADPQLAQKVAVRLYAELKAAGVPDPLEFLRAKCGAGFSFQKHMFKDNAREMVRYFEELRRRKLLSPAEYDAAIQREVFNAGREASERGFALTELKPDEAFALWRQERQRGVTGIAYLRKLREALSLQGMTPSGNSNRWAENKLDDALAAGVSTHPGYAKYLSQVQSGLASDFRALLGVGPQVKADNPEFLAAFKAKLPEAKEFIQLVFNMDGVRVPVERKPYVSYRDLDPLAEMFTRDLIPTGGLSTADYMDIWGELSAKRSSRFTDRFFEKHLYDNLRQLPPARRDASLQQILEYGQVRSERLKNELLRQLLEADVAKLAANAGALPDRSVYELVKRIGYYSGDTSRFRDDLVEDLAWRLELSEGQVLKFIEPMKGFNYQAIDPQTVNMLSAVNVLMGKLRVREKIDLIKYIQEPRGDLLTTVPTLGVNLAAVEAQLGSDKIKANEVVERLENFIWDANDSERLVLIEQIVGTRGHGLWYQGPEVREELYGLAGMVPGSTKRAVFDSYIRALPEYEHTITLSHLLAAKGSAESSELLRTLEMFQAPGLKFAQVASILGTFGPEESRNLAKAKNRALPPTKAEVYALLRKHYTSEQFASIKSVKRRLGSGSLKYVVLVEFKNGSRQAVYIRRPHLDETIQSTLELAESWMKYLRENPEFASAYDYDYYLTSLKEQLALEKQFVRELQLSEQMAQVYARVPKYKGWAFVPVRPSPGYTQGDQILHYAAIENAVEFDRLSPADKKIVSEYIEDTELTLLLDKGTFDADRHLGNYLIDPVKKLIYPVDMGQAYRLRPNGFLRPGDSYQLARIIYGISQPDAQKGSEMVVQSFLDIAVGKPNLSVAQRAKFASEVEQVLRRPGAFPEKVLAILAKLTENRVRIPMDYSLGIFKGLLIVTQEDYAKQLPPEFVQSRVARFVRKQMLLGTWYQLTGTIREWVGRFSCAGLLTRRTAP